MMETVQPMRLAGLAALIALSWAAPQPSAAQTKLEKPQCTDANIASANDKVMNMPENDKKQTAKNEINLARDALAKGASDECETHLQKASLQTK